MKLKITILFLFIGLNLIAQSTFKEGYFINDKGIKKEGFIMTFGTNTPNEIVFKEKKNSFETIQLKKTELSELYIEDIKFINKNVKAEFLDKNMTAKKENNSEIFNLNSKKLLLKVLFESNDFKLYSYQNITNEYFFIESNEDIEYLKYKVIKKNKRQVKVKKFITQLLEKLKIVDEKTQNLIGKLKYNENDLVHFLIKHAENNNYEYKKYKSYIERDFIDAFNITPKLGYYLTSQSIMTESENFETSFNESNVSMGLEIEYFSNSKLKKSSLVLSYIYYNKIKNEGDFTFVNASDSKTFNTLKTSTLNLKYRRYFVLNENQYIYGNIGVLVHSSSGKTEYIFTQTNANIADLEYENNINNIGFSLGIGYNFNKIYFELNYIPRMTGGFESLTDNATIDDWEYKRNMLNFSIGYSIF